MTMQEKILAAWTAAIAKRGYEAVLDLAWSNVGTLRAMNAFRTVRYVSFQFNAQYLSMAVDEPNVIGKQRPFGYVLFGDEDSLVEVAGIFDSLPRKGFEVPV